MGILLGISVTIMALMIGCAGWSYKDWVGPFYPKDVTQKGWLAYYGKFFPTVEINSTFYAVPNRYTVQAWVDKGRAISRARDDGFSFSIKLPQTITHEHMVNGKVDDAVDETTSFEGNVMMPLRAFDLVGAVLVQLSPYFRYDSPKRKVNLKALDRVLHLLRAGESEVAVEFRHRSWTDRSLRSIVPEAADILKGHGAMLCETDGPGFPTLRLSGSKKTYIRLHGRNQDIWFKKGSGSSNGMEEDPKGRFNRYDYLYSGSELTPWAKRLEDEEKGFVYFNNHPRGKGPKNALMLMDMLGIAHDLKDIKMAEQGKLF